MNKVVCQINLLGGVKDSPLRRLWKNRALFVAWGCAGLFLFFQLHQLLAFNPYWGYDGGAHLHILETLAREHRFPTLAENYLAWHEPLYYLLLAGLRMVFVPFWFSHFLFVLVMDGLVYALMREAKMSMLRSTLATIAILSLPAFLETSMFLTNEVLNYVFLLGITLTTLRLWKEKEPTRKTAFLFVLCVALGVVTKITAVVALGVAGVLLILKALTSKSGKVLLPLLFAVIFSALLYAPWLVIRNDGLSKASINNYDMLPAKPLVWDERVDFLMRFDADIFQHPFWYSGGRGFWSMLYADTVSDYSGLFEHQDRKNLLPETQRVWTSEGGATSVSAYRKPLALLVLQFGWVPVGVLLLSVFGCLIALLCRIVSRAFRARHAHSLVLPTLGFFSAFLLALLYYAYRYPYYDQGVIKSIFIAPGFVLPFAVGMKAMERLPRLLQGLLLLLWGTYFCLVLALFFIPSI